jgi:hypothetical protein
MASLRKLISPLGKTPFVMEPKAYAIEFRWSRKTSKNGSDI